MNDYPEKSTYHEAGCVFEIDRTKKVLKVDGTPETARLVVLKLRKEQWVPSDINAIWFTGNPAVILRGVNLTMYLASKPPKPRPTPRTFKDVVQTTS